MSQDIVSERTRELLVAMRRMQKDFDSLYSLVAAGFMFNQDAHKERIGDIQNKTRDLVLKMLADSVNSNLWTDEKRL